MNVNLATLAEIAAVEAACEMQCATAHALFGTRLQRTRHNYVILSVWQDIGWGVPGDAVSCLTD